MTATIEYRSHADFTGYRIGDDGSVWTEWTFKGGGYAGTPEWYLSGCWRQLKPDIDKRGRSRVYLRSAEREYTHKFVHVLVLEAFIGPRPPKYQACHNNGDTTDNRLQNLRWDTVSNNHMDKHRHGTMQIGSKHSKAKLTETQVWLIPINLQHSIERTIRAPDGGYWTYLPVCVGSIP